MTSVSTLQKLRAATSLHDVAGMLGYKPSSLSYLLYKINSDGKYTSFEIVKKSGGFRQIDAPIPEIKALQRRLANLLNQTRVEIEARAGPRRSISHGFRQDHSIITNARPHRKHRYVLNLDLQNFFPSLNFGRVRGFFLKNRDYELNKSVARILAQIACHKNALPQGSPCSPIISDLITHALDVRLAQLAKRNRCVYTRYADDLTFSSNQRKFPIEIAARDEAVPCSPWQLGDALVDTIHRAGYTINPSKTRMQVRTSRQTVTGLVVNQRVNVRSELYRSARAMCDRLFSTGTFHLPSFQRPPKTKDRRSATRRSSFNYALIGRGLNYLRNTARRTRDFLLGIFLETSERKSHVKKTFETTVLLDHPPSQSTPKLSRLEGILNHIYYVKDQSDIRKTDKKRNDPSPIRKLYREFLFFKYFVDIQKPLLICEGKTDNIYLKLAMRKLAVNYPALVDTTSKPIKTKLQFFNRNKLAHGILKLDGGSAGLNFLIRDYKKMLKRYKHAPLLHPVIILIDNDDGAKIVFSAAKEVSGITVVLASSVYFYHLCHNLYLIKTPEGPLGSPKSCIEDLFDEAIRKTEIDGKKFNPSKEHEAPGEYGKVVFAEKVVLPNAGTIDFSKFSTLLDRIVSVISHYNPPSAPTPLPTLPDAATSAA